jgi:hypothetical protein
MIIKSETVCKNVNKEYSDRTLEEHNTINNPAAAAN